MSKEYILCAAIWYQDNNIYEGQPCNIENGFVVSGRRHSDCYSTVIAIVGLDKGIEMKLRNVATQMDRKLHQGFITNLNRYVGRAEAYQIAKEANQIKFGGEAIDKENQILISENLY